MLGLCVNLVVECLHFIYEVYIEYWFWPFLPKGSHALNCRKCRRLLHAIKHCLTYCFGILRSEKLRKNACRKKIKLWIINRCQNMANMSVPSDNWIFTFIKYLIVKHLVPWASPQVRIGPQYTLLVVKGDWIGQSFGYSDETEKTWLRWPPPSHFPLPIIWQWWRLHVKEIAAYEQLHVTFWYLYYSSYI